MLNRSSVNNYIYIQCCSPWEVSTGLQLQVGGEAHYLAISPTERGIIYSKYAVPYSYCVIPGTAVKGRNFTCMFTVLYV